MTGSPGYEPEGEGTAHLEKEKEKTQKKKASVAGGSLLSKSVIFQAGS